MFFYISPICPETPIGWIYNKFGTMGLLADVINCANFFIGRSGGIDSVGRGVKFAVFHRSPLTLSELRSRL